MSNNVHRIGSHKEDGTSSGGEPPMSSLEARVAKLEATMEQIKETQASKEGLIQTESSLRSDMHSMEQGIRSDMNAMEKGIRSDMNAMEKGIRSDMGSMEQRLQSNIHNVENQLLKTEGNLKAEMRDLHTNLTRWMLGLGVTTLIAIAGAVIKLAPK